MRIYPAIDILGGKAVRLRQGRVEDRTVYGEPVEIAGRWAEAGAEWLHIVDLDGAFEGRPKNTDAIHAISKAFPKLQIQSGGGLRDLISAGAVAEAGVHRLILGTSAVKDERFLADVLGRFPGRIAVGIDARDGIVRIAGWVQESGVSALDLAVRLESLGVNLAVYTDIARDGVFEGPNVTGTIDLLKATHQLRIIASGGVSGIEDIDALRAAGHPRLEGVIVGKALYEGRLQLEDALAHAR